jgi:hypothetical protein
MRPHHGILGHAPSRAVCLAFIGSGLAALALGCGGQQKPGSGNPADLKLSSGDFGAKFDRSRCDDRGKQVVSLDANGDGKPDVIKLFLPSTQDGHQIQQLVCKQTDLDFDGKMDLIQYYGPSGELFMDEYSMNYSGKFNGRTFFQDGKKVRAEKDMDFDGKPDYFEFYEGGRLVRVERDRNDDGKIDEWQYYENGRLDRIGYDTTGSGRVDKWERNTEGGLETAVAQEGGAGTTLPPNTSPAAAADAAAAAAAADAASRGAPRTEKDADKKSK